MILDLSQSDETCKRIRVKLLELFQVNGGHYGGCFSCVEILYALFCGRFNPVDVCDTENDLPKFVLSKGHSVGTVYAILDILGHLPSGLSRYGELDSPLEGHPDMTTVKAISFSTGSLGQGLSVSIGMSIGHTKPVWTLLGDGECQEGQVWEAVMLAKELGLGNLCAIVDCNGFQEFGASDLYGNPERISIELLKRQWSGFGWDVVVCDGHNIHALVDAMELIVRNVNIKVPHVLLASTIKGKGVAKFVSNPRRYHCTSLSFDETQAAIEELQCK